ncbi:uncharacterized protein LOC127931174 [Oncorhynchus keta]|uniref:uncharacterized protein LOC127931174 n=1 Tax=Oncorhynchus keta TaxID=8018 RepID=UPI00227A1CFE|nr:uncharacterized protein LOC127931174 [Oncorhynchus keta]
MANGSKSTLTYAFLDSGSSATFCTERLMRQLQAKGSETEILLRTMGQESPTKSFEISGLEIGNVEGDTFLALPKVYTQNKIPVTRGNIPTQKDLKRWPYLKEVQLKEIDADVELLIGVNAPKAMEPWKIINGQGNGPYAVKTLFGWVMNGPLNNCTMAEESGHTTVMANRISIADLGVLLVNQYNHDFPERGYEEKSEMSAEDRRFMEIVSSSITLKDHHYYLPLPFRKTDVVLPNNRDMAKQRALNIIRKFKKDKGYAAEYKGFMEEMITKGYAEKVPQEQLLREKGKVWYIPHHGVHHKRKGTIRVVFDCSSSYKGISLNSELLQGPNLANTLIGVLLRFRQEHIAMMADIEGMFHQVRVHEDYLDFLRFLWWPDGDTNKRLEEYRMTVHLFGAISSPSCANFALRKTAEDNCERYDEEVIQTVKSNFYVDDCLKSVATEEQAIALTKNLRDVCSQGGFKLTKWVSNSRTVLASIPDEHKAKQIKEMDLDREKLPVERALGIRWNIESDAFTFRVTVKNRPLTRRGILSTVSSIYDPLGFRAPFVLKAKQILQVLCKLKCGWDEVIPEEHSISWQRWLSELDQLSRFQIDRCMMPENFGQVKTAQLHHFGDASEQGYGTASYLRFTNGMEKVHIAFILGKSRVTPLKQMTIPRLELAAATLAVRVDRMLKLELQIELEESTFWMDSQSVLKYIRNDTKRFHTFVVNRVGMIRDLSKAKQWRYLNSKHNPADDASRGLYVEMFLNSKRWHKGPEFLEKPETQWPKVPEELGSIPPDDPEVRKDVIVNHTSVEEKSPTSKLIEYYSTWNSLKKAVAWMLKLKKRLLQLSQKRNIFSQTGPDQSLTNSLKEQIDKLKLTFGKESLSVYDLDEAEKVIIRFEQRQHFKQDIALVVKGKQCAKRSGSICKLDPIVDNGILRVGGRLTKAAMPTEL